MKSALFCLSAILFVATIQATPWIAEPRGEDWWIQRHDSFKQNTISNGQNINVIFYGDSITEGWGGEGRAIFESTYAPLGTANYGIGGDRTEHLLYRISNGEVDNLSPKLVVLKIGTNNGGDSVEDVARGITAVVELLRQRLPMAKILLLGVLPRNDANWFTRVASINAQISVLNNGNTIRYLDMFDQFSASWGEVKAELYTSDKLHLVAAGYQTWKDTMAPLFNQMLNA